MPRSGFNTAATTNQHRSTPLHTAPGAHARRLPTHPKHTVPPSQIASEGDVLGVHHTDNSAVSMISGLFSKAALGARSSAGGDGGGPAAASPARVFELQDRIHVLADADAPAVVPHVADASGVNFTYEAIFRVDAALLGSGTKLPLEVLRVRASAFRQGLDCGCLMNELNEQQETKTEDAPLPWPPPLIPRPGPATPCSHTLLPAGTSTSC
eukprot:351630-Chlamydomonas_euryale.AAC.1